MDGKKEYTIVINGVKESIDAVSALNKQLDALDARIKTLETSNVKINATSSGGGSNASALSEEAAVQKEINKLKQEGATLDAKIVAAQDEVFKKVDATKQLYKETIADQKAMAAQERLYADTYSTTMQGMKQHLADLKAVINTTDLGDSDQIKKLTQEAGELTSKLKEMEEAYGVYSRDVGNYANGVREGIKGLAIQVGDSTKEFDNAKQALKELKKERDTLAVKKDMGLISDEEAKRLEQLIPTVAQLQSAIQDAGKPMDALMDSMQSVMALAQTGKGFAAFFGFDDDEVERSIQKLVALQNAMQGLQTLQKQMQSQEGIGSWLTKGNDAIDKLVSSIFGVGKASKTATVATKALGTALKALGIGAIVAGVTTLIDLLERWSNKQKKAAEEAEEAAEKVRKSVDDQRQSYVNASAQYMNTASRLSYLRTEYEKSNDELRKTNIIKEAASEFKKLGIEVKSASDAQRIFVNDGDKVIQLLKLQGDAAAVAALRMEAFKKSFQMLMENGYDANSASILAGSNKTVVELDERLNQINDQASKLKQALKIEDDFTKKSKELVNKRAKEEAEIEKDLIELKISLMEEGLNKELKQLEHEKNQRLAKVKSNGTKVGELSLRIEELYAKKEKQIREKNAREVEKIYSEMWSKIHQIQSNSIMMNLDTSLTQYENKLESEFNKLQGKLNSRYASYSIQYPSNMSKEMADSLGIWEMGSEAKGMKENVTMAKEYLDILEDIELAKSKAFAYKGSIIESGEDKKAIEESKKALEEWLEIRKTTQEEMEGNLLVQDLRDKGYTRSLSNAYKIRIADIKKYYYEYEKLQNEYETKRLIAEREILDEEFQIQRDAEYARFNESLESLKKNQNRLEEEGKDFNALWNVEVQAHKDALKAIEEKANSESERLELEHQERLRDIVSESLDGRIQEYRDFYTAIGNLESRQPEKMGGFLGDMGIINISKTKKNYEEALDGYKNLMKSIQNEKNELQKQFDNHEISFNDFQQAKRELNDLEQACADGAQQTQDGLKNLTSDFIGSINQYVQLVGQTINSVLNAVWTAQDAAYEREKERLEEQLDFVRDRYDKMSELADEYSSRIKESEGLIATAQGDARDALLDRYNAELQAERRSIMEKKKAAKEEEKLKAKADKLDKEQREKQKQRDIIQALINTSMAISMASVNTWPMPAIAMMAAAAVAGAAQVAAIASQHYATGGVIEGKSHAQGGVKALVGGNYPVELEGQEYVIRKKSTTPNVGVLDFINKSERKLKLEDFIDFFTTGKIKSTIISSSPRTKFADGGIVPTLRNDITINDRMIKAIEDYSNRPVYVAVTEIQDKMESVNYVKTLAGLNPEY